MSATTQPIPTSRLRFGFARVDITPPVGIYHRMWGAARQDRSTGVHRLLFADVMLLSSLDGASSMMRIQIDLVGIDAARYRSLAQAAGEAGGVPADRVIISFSHTHAAGLMTPDRVSLPGGDLIPAYLETLETEIRRAARHARSVQEECIITYAVGRCDLAANRDYWDEERQLFACGFNPDAPADDTLMVARVIAADGAPRATIVNYACHPTTLAWDNTLISPDYVGALRETVQSGFNAPCIFFQGACGELGPKEGYVGDTSVADRNGRQVGYAALSTLNSMGAPATDYVYQGPVISGATVGTWRYTPLSPERMVETTRFSGGQSDVELPLKPKPDASALQADLARWEAEYGEAEAAGKEIEARNARAHAERARRWLMRLRNLPEGESYPFPFSVYRLGDALWVTCGGEPSNLLQTELRRRFPSVPILLSPLAGDMQAAYLLPRDRYGLGLYQEEPSILAPGCLELLIDAIGETIEEMIG
ncbi:MAG: hypothetical protein KF893_12710 [Caldilineaceae bacterium]|nr:hypothetical protein [Caldilineaceae bacterium]